MFDRWVRRDVGRVFVQTFDVALSAWLGQGAPLCIFNTGVMRRPQPASSVPEILAFQSVYSLRVFSFGVEG